MSALEFIEFMILVCYYSQAPHNAVLRTPVVQLTLYRNLIFYISSP